MAATRRIYDAITGGSGFFQHGHTYVGHATACAGALAVQDVIESEGLLTNVLARGAQLRDELRTAFADHPHVGDVRGRGLFVGIEFVADRASKQTLDPQLCTHAKLKLAAMRNGLLVYPMGGTMDGISGDHALIAPPFICTAHDISAIVDRFVSAVDAVILRG